MMVSIAMSKSQRAQLSTDHKQGCFNRKIIFVEFKILVLNIHEQRYKQNYKAWKIESKNEKPPDTLQVKLITALNTY